MRSLHKLLRSVGAVLVVLVTSTALIASPAYAASWPSPPDGSARVVARTAGKVGTKAVPLRFIGCGSLPGLVACTAGAAGIYWLTETDSGREFGQSVLEDLGLDSWFGRGTDRQCMATVEPVAWAQHQVSTSLEITGAISENLSCYQGWMNGSSGWWRTAASLEFDCIQADGSLYKNAFSWQYASYPDGLWSPCNISADDWLIGMQITASPSPGMGLTSSAYYKNPVWNGVPGADPNWWRDNIDKPKTRATIECRAADGSTYTKTVTVDGLVDPPLACDNGASIIGRTVEALRNAGKVVQTLYDVGVTPEAIGEYPECFTGGAFCDLAVTVDGMLCTTGRSDCLNWWDIAQQSPGRVKCIWGPYTLGYADCRELRNAYESPDGAWYPPDLAPGAPPIPYYPTNPDYRPPPQGKGADPSWLHPQDCPPLPNAGMEYGLQPIALQGVRCFMSDHPDFVFSSGFRAPQAGQISDHPHGLAVDLVPPNWDTPAGNQRGWDAVAYWIWNSPALGVRYVIYDGQVWWPDSGWHVYVDPDGSTHPHDDHVHVSFDPYRDPSVYRPPSTAPDLPYPEPTPNPEPRPPTNPQPDPNPNPDPDAPGVPEADGPNCDGSEVTWNPRSWVVVPLKCAFVPSDPVLQEAGQRITTTATQTGVPTWLDTLGAIPPALDVEETAGCMGPPMVLPDAMGGMTIYLFEACDGIRATMAAFVKTTMTVSLVVGVLLTSTTLLGRGFGYDAGTGGGSTSA